MVGCHSHMHLLPRPAIAPRSCHCDGAAAELSSERGCKSFRSRSSAAFYFQCWRISLLEAGSDHVLVPCVQSVGGWFSAVQSPPQRTWPAEGWCG